MSNNRVFYALESVAIGGHGSASGTPVHGVQSAEMNTSFELEQVFELGQLDLYENIENIPSIDATVEKVLDGYPLIYHLSSQDATSPSLLNRVSKRCDLFFNIFSDEQSSASGQPLNQVYASGMYIDSLDYTLPVEGNATESVSLVGNDKTWITSSGTSWAGGTGFAFDGHFDGDDSPSANSGVQRRQDVIMGASPTGSIWPSQIPGLTVTNGSGYNVESNGQLGVHFQDVSISVNLGREDLFELGRRKPYYRFASFPTSVDTTINVNAAGNDPGDLIDADSSQDNLVNEPIMVKLADSTTFDLGTKNKLQSVSTTMGDTGGSNATITYNYQNFNILEVTSNSDPAGQ